MTFFQVHSFSWINALSRSLAHRGCLHFVLSLVCLGCVNHFASEAIAQDAVEAIEPADALDDTPATTDLEEPVDAPEEIVQEQPANWSTWCRSHCQPPVILC